jgi:DNA phosphorothioation-dependent restriction protein DptG
MRKNKHMAQQTAVEWLVNQVEDFFCLLPVDMIEKAKDMEKQHHDKWNKFLEIEKVLGISDVKTIERIQWYYNQYYNETYGKQ